MRGTLTDQEGNVIPQKPTEFHGPQIPGTPTTGKALHTVSPIILDLDRNGINTTDEWGYYFDHNGNGLRESTGWVGQGDGLLVRDINGNGVIDDGGELFGNNTLLKNGQKAANGFEALAEFDENGDGVIDANDAIYHELKVWVDANGDGKTDAGELKTLAELGIASIGTGYTESKHKDENGNLHKQIGEITFTDGTTSQAVDVWFEANLAKRREDDSIVVTDEIRALANVAAFGDMHDLHQAMVLDPSLKELLAVVVATTDATQRSALLDKLIYRWAGAEDVLANSRGQYMDARQLVTLERLTSSDYWGTPCAGVSMNLANPHGNAAPILIAEYNKFKQFVEAQILAQTRYNLGDIVLTQFGSMTDDPEVDWQKLLDRLYALTDNNQIQEAKEIVAVIEGLGLYSKQHTLNCWSFFYSIAAHDEARFVPVLNSMLYLTGSGDVQINITSAQYQNIKMVCFGKDVDPGTVKFVHSGNNLQIKTADGRNLLTVTNYFLDSKNPDTDANLYQPLILFKDGYVWGVGDIEQTILNGLYTDGDGVITSYYGYKDAVVYGGAGNDTLIGAGIFSGGEGNDTIRLPDWGNNQTILFNLGDGQDVINPFYSSAVSKIVFGSDVTSDMISFRSSGKDLIVVVGDQGDQITIKSFSAGDKDFKTLRYFEFADGTVWVDIRNTPQFVNRSVVAAFASVEQAETSSQVNNLISAMAAFAPEAGVSSSLPTNHYDPNSVMLASSAA